MPGLPPHPPPECPALPPLPPGTAIPPGPGGRPPATWARGVGLQGTGEPRSGAEPNAAFIPVPSRLRQLSRAPWLPTTARMTGWSSFPAARPIQPAAGGLTPGPPQRPLVGGAGTRVTSPHSRAPLLTSPAARPGWWLAACPCGGGSWRWTSESSQVERESAVIPRWAFVTKYHEPEASNIPEPYCLTAHGGESVRAALPRGCGGNRPSPPPSFQRFAEIFVVLGRAHVA